MSQSRSPKKPPNTSLFRHKQWQQCYENWLRSVRELSGSLGSERTYRSITCAFFNNPKRTPDSYTRAEIETFVRGAFIRHGVSQQPRAATQNNRLVVLRSFYGYAAQYDVPFRKSTRPILHRPDPT
ncbi:MAG: hypothetical protein ACRDHW_00250, partial [Ktedonobacteraceae bacterium]